MVASVSLVAFPAVAFASDCTPAKSPEECLASTSCAWLMLQGQCKTSDSADALASPSICCSSSAPNSTCAHSTAELPDGICALTPGGRQISSFDLNYAIRMAHMAGAAYCRQDQVTSWTCGTHCSSVQGLENIQYVLNEKQVLAGFVGWDSSIGAIVVSFRGTVQSITDWVHNLAYTKSYPFDQHPEVGVHHGFWNAWQYLKDPMLEAIKMVQEIHPGNKVVLTGHSLGAAIAADAALDLSVNHGMQTSVVNFGSPRAGDLGFNLLLKREVPNFWRVTHDRDLVPHVPPEAFGFYHASTEIFFPGSDTHYQVCDESGEDASCSDRCAKWLTCTSVADHLNYFGISLEEAGCDSSVVV